MPPKVALLAYIVLAIWLLRIERQQNPEASPILWIPTLYFMIMASRPVALWIHPGGGSGGSVEEGSAPDRLVLGALMLITFIVLYRRKIDLYQLVKNNRWLILLYFFLALSILWSDYPFNSFKRWVKLFGILIMGLMIVSEQKPLQALESIFRRSAYILIPLSIVLIKYFPAYGVSYTHHSGLPMGTGVATQKNGLGGLCCILVFFLIWRGWVKWRVGDLVKARSHMLGDAITIGIGFFLLFGGGNTYSATSILVFIIGMLFLILFYRFRSLVHFISRNIKVVLIISVVLFNLYSNFLLPFVTSSLNRRTDLTDRDIIWKKVYEISKSQPVLGTGYGAFWGLDPRSFECGVNQAHNGYLDVYVQVGIVGVVFLTLFFLEFCGNIRKITVYNYDWALFSMCICLMLLLHNYTEATLIKSGSHWTITVFFTIAFSNADLYLRKDANPWHY